MDVTVVVPTRNRPGLLADTIRSLRAQNYKGRWELIVVDDGSTPALNIDVRTVRHETARGVNAARNSGVADATADLVVFVDDDIDAPPGWLTEFVAGAGRHPDAWCFGGKVILRHEGEQPVRHCDVSWWESQLDLGDEGTASRNVCGANLGLRKHAIEQAGGFAEELPLYWDEHEWEDRVRAHGGDIVYLPDAWLWHRRLPDTETLKYRLVRGYKQGYGHAHYHHAQGTPLERQPYALPRALAHAARHRCTNGLVRAATTIGMTAGTRAWQRQSSR